METPPHQGDLFLESSGRVALRTRPQKRTRARARRRPDPRNGQLSLGLASASAGDVRASHGSSTQCLTRRTVIAVSMKRVEPLLPRGSEGFVRRLLREIPTEIVPVRQRRSKHGDFTVERGSPFGRITVNVCGNRYRFLLTLLHELAHARVETACRRRIRPHGPEWKAEFSHVLFRLLRYPVLPARLRRAVYLHALNPTSTDEYDTELQLALRPYDTADQRLTVAEIREGAWFSLEGGLVLRRGRLIRRRIRCTDSRGYVYSVLPAARIDTVFDQ